MAYSRRNSEHDGNARIATASPSRDINSTGSQSRQGELARVRVRSVHSVLTVLSVPRTAERIAIEHRHPRTTPREPLPIASWYLRGNPAGRIERYRTASHEIPSDFWPCLLYLTYHPSTGYLVSSLPNDMDSADSAWRSR